MADYSVSKARRGIIASALVTKFVQKYSPCTEGCSDRNATCRLTCERGKEFEKKLADYRGEINKQIKADNMMEDYYMDKKYKGHKKGGE